MEEFLRQLVEGSSGLVAYASIFGVLVACGLGVPLPEDISLILGGYLAYTGAAQLPMMMAVGFLGILVGDSLVYLGGRKLGARMGRNPSGFFGRLVTPEKRARVEALFARHGQKIVIIARFLPGVRAVTYFTAGSAGMSYVRFILFDGLAAIASAPLFVFLGYKFGGELELLVEALKRGQLRVAGALAVIIAGYLLVTRLRRRRERSADARLQAELVSSSSPVQEPEQ